MTTRETRVQAVIECGFTPRQARFLATVMQHAGVCIARQYCDLARIAYGQQMHDFFRALVDRRLAKRYPCPDRRGHLYHVHGARLYRAIGEPHHRHRRIGSLGLAVERLMLLDAVLMAPDISWCGNAEEQRALLAERGLAEVDEERLSALADVMRPRPGHAGERPPIGVREHDQTVVFLYLVTTLAPVPFRRFFRQSAPLLRLLPRWTIRLVFSARFAGAEAAYRDACQREVSEAMNTANTSLECVLLTHRYHGLAELVGTA